MSYVSNNQKQLILDLMLNRIDESQFFQRFPLEPERKARLSLDVLRAAMECECASDVSMGMLLAFHFGISSEHAELLTRLLVADWHHSHENVASALDTLRYPGAVNALYTTALKKYDYLWYDEAFALGVKCIWALGNIGNAEAVEKLKAISKQGNRILRANARKQLIRLGACKPPHSGGSSPKG
jgi:hypothetical protein